MAEPGVVLAAVQALEAGVDPETLTLPAETLMPLIAAIELIAVLDADLGPWRRTLRRLRVRRGSGSRRRVR